ncbi:MAG: hypothetical protein ABIW19_17870 [Vicinamibacterales bacterium]
MLVRTRTRNTETHREGECLQRPTDAQPQRLRRNAQRQRDFQARRLNLRYRPKDSKQTSFRYTLNNTAIVSTRTMIAILENYQNGDGTVTIPDMLRPHMRNIARID